MRRRSMSRRSRRAWPPCAVALRCSACTTLHCSERRWRCTPKCRAQREDIVVGATVGADMFGSLEELIDGLSIATVATTVFDILLVYYLIYRLLLTIRGTRAAQMIVGIVLVGAAFFVAERLELSTVSWLLDNFISYFIILIIVVFQQDIRRALGRIGQNVLPFGRRQETSAIVDEVVAATAQIARARLGAIIVFERDAALEEFV